MKKNFTKITSCTYLNKVVYDTHSVTNPSGNYQGNGSAIINYDFNHPNPKLKYFTYFIVRCNHCLFIFMHLTDSEALMRPI